MERPTDRAARVIGGLMTGSGPTAQVVALRRLAEAEARAAVEAARGQLAVLQAQAERLRRQMAEAEQALLRARATARELTGPLLAGRLASIAEALARQASSLRRLRDSAEGAATDGARAAQRLELRRREWLGCVARREAAELHAELERREQRRQRAQREAHQDDEARERYASATRLGNRQT